MRRLLSYLLLSITTFLLIGFNLLSVVGGLNANLEFSSGREMVFRISDKLTEDTLFSSDDVVRDVADTMIERLENALVSKYDVWVEGNNQIRVTVSEATDIKYQRLATYLAFDADFTISTKTEVSATNDQMFDGQVARVEYRGQTPFVVIPLKDPSYLKEVLVTEAEGSNPGQDAGGQGSGDGELLLWAGKTEADNYEDSLDDAEMREKIILRFTTGSMWWDAETQQELASAIAPSKYGSPNANNVFDAAAVTQANEEAIYYRNLFNASALPVNVELLFSTPVQPTIEPILNLAEILTLSWSQTLIASIIAVTLIAGVLIYLYRLPAIGVLATTALSLFASFIAFIWLKLEFSSAALVGLMTIGALGLFTSILYLTYFRREVYAGRSLKKAHIEANGDILPIVLDTTIIVLIFGLFAYLFAGNLVQNFAVFIMIGAISNLLIVYLGNQVLFGLLFQEYGLLEKLPSLAIQPKLIPNVTNDEKPVYFGRFSGRDFTSKGALLSPITFSLATLSLAGAITLGVLNVPIVQPAVNPEPSRLYLEVKDFSQFENTADVEAKLLDTILLDGEALDYAEDIAIHELVRVEDDIDVNYRIYVIDILSSLDAVTDFSFAEDDFVTDDFNILLEHIVYAHYEDEQVAVVSFLETQAITNQPTVIEIALGTLIALAFVGVYLLLRQSFAKAFAIVTLSGTISVLTLGFFMATRIPVFSTMTLALLPITLMSVLTLLVIFAQSQRALAAMEGRRPTMDEAILSLRKATSLSATPIFITLGSLLYVSLAFFGVGPASLQGLAATLLLGSLLAALLVTSLLPNTYKPFYRLFKGFNVWLLRPRKKEAKRMVDNPRSAEPQEATYIGIND
jgi:preprotein translocase subunit SecD